MLVIKRYANRKLYDTEAKRYVTLEDLAELVRQGEDVRVLDHVTGDDLTSITLLQVAFEEEKKIGGLLPQVFLTRLIRAGGGTMNALVNRLSTLNPFQAVDDEIRRRIEALLEQGRISDDEAQRWLDLLIRKPLDEAVHVPVRDDETAPEQVLAEEEAVDPQEVTALMQQVDMLEQELERLRANRPPVPPQIG